MVRFHCLMVCPFTTDYIDKQGFLFTDLLSLCYRKGQQSYNELTGNMKNVLKAWLADNNVTPDQQEEKILVLENAGSLGLEDVLEEMGKQNTGLRPETMAHSVELFLHTVENLILNGHSVNTGLFRAVVQFRGVTDNGVWNPQKNKAYVLFTQDKMLRDHINATPVKILGEKKGAIHIIATEDTATGATDGTATPGRAFRLKGKNIKVAGPDEGVGIYLTGPDGSGQKLPDDLLVKNNPSEVMVQLPADLAEGRHELRIVTQFSTGNKLLKEPRATVKQFFVGDSTARSGGNEGNMNLTI